MKRWLRLEALWLVPGIVLLGIDQAIKRWGIAHLVPRARHPLFGMKSLVFSMYFNRTPAGGLSGSWNRLAIPSALWTGLLVTALIRFRRATKPELIGYFCLLAGGASNLWDQWRLKTLVDTFQWLMSGHRFIPFNLADLTVSLSATALAVLLFFRMVRDASRPKARAFTTSSRLPLRARPRRSTLIARDSLQSSRS